MISLLLFALLMEILVRGREEPRWYWTLPGLFLVWANAHGSFPLGLVIFGIFVACDFVIPQFRPAARAQRGYALPAAFLLSAAATLLNPFTYRVYLEAVRHSAIPCSPRSSSGGRRTQRDSGIVMGSTPCARLGLLARGRKLRLAFLTVALLTFPSR